MNKMPKGNAPIHRHFKIHRHPRCSRRALHCPLPSALRKHRLTRLLRLEPRHWPGGQHGQLPSPARTARPRPAHSQLFLTTPPAAVLGTLGALCWTHRRPEPCVGRGLSVRQVTLDKLSTPASPAPDHKQNRASPRPRTLPRALPPTGMPTSSAACWLHGDTLNTLSPQDPAPCSSLSEGGSSARSRPRPHQLTRLPGADADESLSRIQLHGGHGHRPRPYD